MAKRNFDDTNRADTSKKQKYSRVFNLKENSLMPSLLDVSMSKVAITLWNQADIRYQIVKYFHKVNSYDDDVDDHDEFLKIVDKVLENLLPLALPNHVREMLSKIVHPIGSEIFVWLKYQDGYVFHDEFLDEICIALNYIDDLVWTPRGIIDYKETAKTLLAKGGILCDLYKYNIACEYCLEDDIAIIAPKVINTTLNLDSYFISDRPMLYFWTAHITGDFTELTKAVNFYNLMLHANYSTNECLFKVLISNGPNEVAIKYIWDKLSHEEQSRQIARAIVNTSNNDVRFFLLSQISKEQEKELFEKFNASGILLHFLGDRLWGHYFLPTLHNIWHLMHGCDYVELLEAIGEKIESSHECIAKHEEYKATFKEVWKSAPKQLKDYVFEDDGYDGHYMFFNLFDKKNIDIIQSILFDLNDVQKKKIMFSGLSGMFTRELYFDLITSNQLDLFEWLIGNTLFCKEDVDSFKQSLMDKIGQKIAAHFIHKEEWNKVQQFLKWAFISDDDIRVFKLKLMKDIKM